MSKIHYIGDRGHTTYMSSSFSLFKTWFKEQKIISHDVETNVVKSVLERVLITLQYSDVKGNDNWVIQWSYLSEEEKDWIRGEMGNSQYLFIIYASQFEYSIWRHHNVCLENVFDCYLAEQILNTGKHQEQGMFSLQGVLKRRFDIDISKAAQLTFGDNVLTDEKIKYAATDTLKLGLLRINQLREMYHIDNEAKLPFHKGLKKTLWWDNQFILAVGDMEYDGILFDKVKWIANYQLALPVMEQAREALNDIIKQDFERECIMSEFLYTEDKFISIWGSAKKKLGLLQLIFKDIEETNKLALKKYLATKDPDFPEGLALSGKAWEESDYPFVIKSGAFSIIKILILMNKKNQDEYIPVLNKIFYSNFKDYMLENDLVIPKGKICINWASPVQKLRVFKWINVAIENTTAQTVEDNMLEHRIFREYAEYQEAYGLTSKFGLDYLQHVDEDGRIRTSFNTILSTGRLSARVPNLLQLPRKQAYRDCFIAGPRRKIVGADYSAIELVIIALLSNEPVWLNALKAGHDLHSITASLIYGQKWIDGTEADCKFAKNKDKCNCKIHKDLRSKSKAISFGLSYGLSAHGAAIRLHISKEEAQELIQNFFKTFGSIQKFLVTCGSFGLDNLFITEPVTGRYRFYEKKRLFIEGEKESIVRQSMNFPIQSAAANILKIAGVLLRRWIKQENLRGRVKLILPVHDEYLLDVEDALTEYAAEKLTYYMELAGKLSLKSNLFKAGSYVEEHWLKD